MTSERAQKISKEQSARMKRQQTIRDEAKNLAAQEMLQELEGGEYCWDVYLAEDVKEAPPEMLDTLSVPTFDYRQLQDGALHIYLTSDDESDSDDGDDEDLDAREYDYGDEEDDFGAQPSKFMVGDWRGENDRNGSYSAPKSTDIYGFSDSEDEEAMRMSYALRHGNTLSDDELDQDYRMK
jgi:hypothetical protein